MNRTTPKVVESALDRLATAYWTGVDELAARIRADHVVPYCKRTGYDFGAGMGSWTFYRSNVASYAVGRVVDADDIPKRLRAMLDAETQNRGQSIGSLIARDVRASENFK